MSDPYTAAWAEAEASAPPGVVTYSTLELQHPSFLDETETFEVPIRIVAETPEDQLFTIEDGAAFNGGEIAKFLACPFYSEGPDFEEGKMPEVKVTIENVSRFIGPKMDDAVSVMADLVMVFRQYRSDDRTEPCYGPVQFVLRGVTVRGADITGVAQLDDLANSKFPRQVYDATRFPGLLP